MELIPQKTFTLYWVLLAFNVSIAIHSLVHHQEITPTLIVQTLFVGFSVAALIFMRLHNSEIKKQQDE